MPIYDYKCHDCGKEIEVEASVEEKAASSPDKFYCPSCGSKNLKQIFNFSSLVDKTTKKCCTPGGCGC